MLVNLEISAVKESLPALLRRVVLLYSVDACREVYTQLKLLQMDMDGPEHFAEVAMQGSDLTEVERDIIMNTFLTSLQVQAKESKRWGNV